MIEVPKNNQKVVCLNNQQMFEEFIWAMLFFSQNGSHSFHDFHVICRYDPGIMNIMNNHMSMKGEMHERVL